MAKFGRKSHGRESFQLSKTQAAVLAKMKSGEWATAHELRASLATLQALCERGRVEKRTGAGSFTFPRTGIEWRKKTTVK